MAIIAIGTDQHIAQTLNGQNVLVNSTLCCNGANKWYVRGAEYCFGAGWSTWPSPSTVGDRIRSDTRHCTTLTEQSSGVFHQLSMKEQSRTSSADSQLHSQRQEAGSRAQPSQRYLLNKELSVVYLFCVWFRYFSRLANPRRDDVMQHRERMESLQGNQTLVAIMNTSVYNRCNKRALLLPLCCMELATD